MAYKVISPKNQSQFLQKTVRQYRLGKIMTNQICDRILENLPFWHIAQSDGNHPTSQYEGLIVASSKCTIKLF